AAGPDLDLVSLGDGDAQTRGYEGQPAGFDDHFGFESGADVGTGGPIGFKSWQLEALCMGEPFHLYPDIAHIAPPDRKAGAYLDCVRACGTNRIGPAGQNAFPAAFSLAQWAPMGESSGAGSFRSGHSPS